MKKSAGYSINGNVVTLTKAFAKKAYTPGTKEFREFSAIIKAYPNLVVTMRTATITADKNNRVEHSPKRIPLSSISRIII